MGGGGGGRTYNSTPSDETIQTEAPREVCIASHFRSCVRVEGAVLGCPS